MWFLESAGIERACSKGFSGLRMLRLGVLVGGRSVGSGVARRSRGSMMLAARTGNGARGRGEVPFRR